MLTLCYKHLGLDRVHHLRQIFAPSYLASSSKRLKHQRLLRLQPVDLFLAMVCQLSRHNKP